MLLPLEAIKMDNATSHLWMKERHTSRFLQARVIQCFSGVMAVLLPSEIISYWDNATSHLWITEFQLMPLLGIGSIPKAGSETYQDGDIHPHPGPLLRVVSINAGGLAGTWRAVEEFISAGKVDVLGVQEVAASDSELLALRRIALKNGYRIFHVAGNPTRDGWRGVRQRGSVALFVRLLFKIRPAISFVGLDSQCVGVWLDGWFLARAYAPPGYNDEPVLELASGLLEWFSTSVPFSQPWLVFGDFNELVGASKLEIA